MAAQPMRRVDAAWYRMDRPRNTADIVALVGLAERLPIGRIRSLIADRLLPQGPFRQRVREADLGVPSWEDDPAFDLARHVVGPRNVEPRAAALHASLGRLATEPLDPAHSPWRMEVLEGGGKTALALKVHHCVGDGRALVGVLRRLADDAVWDQFPAGHTFRPLALARDGVKAVVRSFRDPRSALRLAAETGAFGGALARLVALPADRPTLLSRPHSGVRRVASTGALPIDRVRAACHRAGVTVNELMLAAIAGALRTVLQRAGEPVDALAPRALMPVDARDPQDRSLGNGFGLVFFELPVLAASAEERLAMIRARSAALRGSPEAVVTLSVLGAFGLLPRPLEHLGLSFFARKASLVVTNVRGPAAPVTLAGVPVDRLAFWVPHPATLGLGISIISYAGTIRVGVRADRAVLADPGELAKAIAAELAVLGVEEEPDRRRRRPVRVPLAVTGLSVPVSPVS
jgi:diacylglycerol O-acyltransferase